jgi:uncharacterized protein (DUF427 family)
MSLTHSPGPLAGQPPTTVNYTIEGPKHRLLLHDFPRRVRAVLAGETVLDTERGALLHETGLLPVLYVPIDDVRQDLLTATDHSTHCPFKGDASYWTLRVGDRVEENVVWGYPEPLERAPWLAGRVAFYWDRMDAWYDEDEQVEGGLRNPFHRVDVRSSGRKVRVLLSGGTAIAAVGDRPAQPVLHPGRRRSRRRPAAERHPHRLPVQGHCRVLVGACREHRTRRRGVVLSGRLRRRDPDQGIPVLRP